VSASGAFVGAALATLLAVPLGGDGDDAALFLTAGAAAATAAVGAARGHRHGGGRGRRPFGRVSACAAAEGRMPGLVPGCVNAQSFKILLTL
jgi:hypothetical protein